MNEFRATMRHTMVYALAAVLNRGAAFIVLPVLTQYLSPEEYGVLGLVTVTAELLGAVAGIKLGAAVSRIYFDHTDEHERQKVFSSAVIGLTGIIAVVMALLWPAAGPVAWLVLGESEHAGLLMLGTAALLLNVLFTLGLQYLTIRQWSGLMTIVSLGRSIGYIGTTLLLVAWLGLGVQGALLALLATNAAMAVGLLVPILWRTGLRFSGTGFVTMVRFGLPLVPGSFAEMGVRVADRMILAHLISLAATGVYFLAFRLAGLMQMLLLGPFNQIYIVRRFEAFSRNQPDPHAARVFTFFFAIIVTGGLALSLFAPELVMLVAYGRPGYHQAAAVIPFLAAGRCIHSILLVKELGIYYRKRPFQLTLANYAMLGAHVGACLLLVPLLGLVGVGVGVCVSSTVRLGLTSWYTRRDPAPRPQWRSLGAVAALAIAWFAMGLLLDRNLDPVASMLLRSVLLIAFPVALWFSPLIDHEERLQARQAAIRLIHRRLAYRAETTPR